jgi:hypothetical protein
MFTIQGQPVSPTSCIWIMSSSQSSDPPRYQTFRTLLTWSGIRIWKTVRSHFMRGCMRSWTSPMIQCSKMSHRNKCEVFGGDSHDLNETLRLKWEYIFYILLFQIPCNRSWGHIGLWDVVAPTFYRQSAHRWRWGCQPYAPAGRPLFPRKIPGTTHFC